MLEDVGMTVPKTMETRPQYSSHMRLASIPFLWDITLAM